MGYFSSPAGDSPSASALFFIPADVHQLLHELGCTQTEKSETHFRYQCEDGLDILIRQDTGCIHSTKYGARSTVKMWLTLPGATEANHPWEFPWCLANAEDFTKTLLRYGLDTDLRLCIRRLNALIAE